ENFQKKKWGWVLGFLITLCILYICMYASSGTKIFNLWHWKDMKALPYMTASMFSIIGFMCIYKPDLKNRVLERVGRYSLFYFIGQGISTSLVRTMANYFNIWWGGRIIIFFVINIAVWFICSEIFLFIYRSIGRIYKRLILLAKK
ncbi:MAG: hypothetical protein J6W96_02870, partial [Alphaproteobacteria bacterium]|nr:hypothetical protein [Alphaproteobacteria bacterium]